jgi:hypothetical protein
VIRVDAVFSGRAALRVPKQVSSSSVKKEPSDGTGEGTYERGRARLEASRGGGGVAQKIRCGPMRWLRWRHERIPCT